MYFSKRITQHLSLAATVLVFVAMGGCSEVEDTYTPEAKSPSEVVKPVQKVNPASFGEDELKFKKKAPAESAKP